MLTNKGIRIINRAAKANQISSTNNTQEIRKTSVAEEIRTNPYLNNKYADVSKAKEQRIKERYDAIKPKHLKK